MQIKKRKKLFLSGIAQEASDISYKEGYKEGLKIGLEEKKEQAKIRPIRYFRL